MTWLLSYLGAGLFALLTGVRIQQALQGNWMGLVLAFHSGLAAYLLVARRDAKQSAPVVQVLLAWVCALLPLLVQVPHTDPILGLVSGVGVLVSIWALLSLWKSFGIAPADRGLVQRGIYRYLRHPMYLGELLSLLFVAVNHLSPWNLAVTGLVWVLIVLRIRWEESLIGGYEAYREQVRWRLLPLVW